MKIFRSEGEKGTYFTTSFYHKNKDTGDEIKRNIYVGFQKGTEPKDTTDFELIARTKDGKEYSVILDCYRKGEVAEPKLFMWQPNYKEECEKKANKFIEENGFGVNISTNDLPFYGG